jgi:hypothetical protein
VTMSPDVHCWSALRQSGAARTGTGQDKTRENDLDDGTVDELLCGWFEG